MTTEAITPLRQRMIEDMNARKLCAGTQRGHIRSCKRFAAFLKRSPDTATCEDIRTFQLHLADTGISICNRNRIMTGLRFLFRVTLRRLDLAEEIYHLREPEKLALVMSVDEIKRLLAVASSLKTRVLLSLSMARAGSRPDPTSSSRCGCSRDCSVGCFCRSLSPPIRPRAKVLQWPCRAGRATKLRRLPHTTAQQIRVCGCDRTRRRRYVQQESRRADPPKEGTDWHANSRKISPASLTVL
jgi:hypothetical protein